MKHHRLPIGIQDFRTIRDDGCYYVDKTPIIRRLVNEGRHYFLSRPRRFGKSLLVDTLKSLFEGKEELFRGLDIHRHWNWSVKHPVVRLSFDGRYNEPGDIEKDVIGQLTIIERNAGLASSPGQTGPVHLLDLLDRLHHATGQRVVVLVDEYDKPILDVLEDPHLAKANRDALRGLYGIIKGGAEHVHFVLVTGVSMFSKVSLFSGLNNLKDISLDPRYAMLCGYTEKDLDDVFAAELDGLDRDEIRRWYNGYHWLGKEKVYNPFDVLLLFDRRQYRPWWFETGSPEFLYRLLMERRVNPIDLENRVADEKLMATFDVGDVGVDALLFQTGYLTITGEKRDGLETFYTLDFPNFEVRRSLNSGLLGHLGATAMATSDFGRELVGLLEANDFAGFGEKLRSYLSGIPYPWHSHGNLARYEAWYASLLYMCFRAIGIDLRVEEASSRGRADMVVFLGSQVFVLEFKMADENAGKALEDATDQMRERGYAEMYRHRGEPVHLVSIAFGHAERNLLGVRAEPA